jgi:hypothetical protein
MGGDVTAKSPFPRLQNGEPPPADYLEWITLTPEEKSALEEFRWIGSGLLERKLARLRPLYLEMGRVHSGEGCAPWP